MEVQYFSKTSVFPHGKILIFRKTRVYFPETLIFPREKMIELQKSDELTMLGRFQPGQALLAPLVIQEVLIVSSERLFPGRADALLKLALPDDSNGFWFVVESKSRSTPQSIASAIAVAQGARGTDQYPLIQVPYLSPEKLDYLESLGLSGVDLCGNGVVIVPGRLWIKRTGQPNRFRDSRPLNNPYGGRSAVVARLLMIKPRWESLGELTEGIRSLGTSLSLPQVSKAVAALAEEMVVSKDRGRISMTDPVRALDQLARTWKPPTILKRQALRLNLNKDWQGQLSASDHLRWAVTGESSVPHHSMFAQGGPRRIAVSSLSQALSVLQGKPESVPSFADVELIETREEGYFFANEIDEQGIRWASLLQTWLEAQRGDARQQDVAGELRQRILREFPQ